MSFFLTDAVNGLKCCPILLETVRLREPSRNFGDFSVFNPLTPNDHYSGRTAPLTFKSCILYIYSTNVGTEYFKHGIYSSFFLFEMQFVS